MGFRATLRALHPARRQVELHHPSGKDSVLRTRARDALVAGTGIAAVCSMYAPGRCP
jgi:hypothetical protein